MQNKNLDGIKYKSPSKPQSPAISIRYVVAEQVYSPSRKQTIWSALRQQKYTLPITAFVIILAAFVGGMSFALQTPKIAAENVPVVEQAARPGMVANLATIPSSTQPSFPKPIYTMCP